MDSKDEVIIKPTNVKKESLSTVEKDIPFFEKYLKEGMYGTHPRLLLTQLSEVFHEYKDAKNEEEKEAKLQVFNDRFSKALYIYGLYNHAAITTTVNESYRPLVVEMSDQIIKDFDCTCAHEKALAEMIASSYVRYIQYSTDFRGAEQIEFLSKEKTQFYTMYSNEADKAHRQFTVALTTLKQLKSPTPQINVRTNTAFVAENQQLNAFSESKKGENING